MDVDEALVNAHLVAVPGLGTLTAGRLANGQAEELGGKTDRAVNLHLLGLGVADKVVANCKLKND